MYHATQGPEKDGHHGPLSAEAAGRGCLGKQATVSFAHALVQPP